MDNKKIIEYCENFYGYGNWNSKIWFIGIEEYGGKTKENVIKRINSWYKYKTNLIDNKKHHSNINNGEISSLFSKGKCQPTWWKLIRLMLNYKNEPVETKDIRNIQKNIWGRTNSETLLIEFFPLPSKSIKDWEYDKYFKDLDFLESREKYYNHTCDMRANFIKNKIKEHQPEIVVFYANKLIKYWNLIVDTDFNEIKRIKINKNYFRYIEINNTLFVQTPQPSGVWSNDFWNKLGKEIRKIKKTAHNK